MRHMRSSPKARLFLQALERRITPSFGEFLDPHPAAGNQFGATVVALSTGNVVVTSPFDDLGGADAGAVYLFNGSTGQLISTLRGSTAGDQIGVGGVTALTNGNYVVSSRFWDNGATANVGAATWCNGNTGTEGAVSVANSLVGSTAFDAVSNNGVTALTNGNYVVRSPNVGNGTTLFNTGAATWGNGATGTAGFVSAANSLVGGASGDLVSSTGVTALTNGNYVVRSGSWDNGAVDGAGAVTWGNGATGIAGVVSAANSLVGSNTSDQVGSTSVTALPNGNYVVTSYLWDNGAATDAGAVTWGNGAGGTVGLISAANSLVGGKTNDNVGNSVLTVLTNGNYVVSSARWDNGALVDAGAVTWGNANGGTIGLISAANSLVGGTADDRVGVFNGGVFALTNGNYVVSSPVWDNGAVANVGAVTWGNGATGTVGVVSAANSLVGSKTDDQVGLNNDSLNDVKGVTALTNGNYVVRSTNWDNGAVVEAGSVTWGNGATGTVGVVSVANSLVGSLANDQVGLNGVTALTNGHYVVCSQLWHNGASVNNAGAVTWGNGNTGTVGVVSSANSLVGSKSGDNVGIIFGNNSGVTALTNGNYVVCSPSWDNGAIDGAGAVTWGNGATGIAGAVSAANSLVGGTASDQLGSLSVTALTNGNYVVSSPIWQNGASVNSGAATFGKGGGETVGLVNTGNSAIGIGANTGLQSAIADNVSGTFLSRFTTEGGGRVRVGSQGNGFAPSVTGFVVNGGAAQRSRLTTIVVNFSSAVDASTLTNPGAITLTRTAGPALGTVVQTGATGANGRILVSPPSGNVTSITLQFDNANADNTTAGVEFGSLADGRWQLAISSAGFVSPLNQLNIFRLVGDADGNGTVNASDFAQFRSFFGLSGASIFDFNNDGQTNATDFSQFRARFGISIAP